MVNSDHTRFKMFLWFPLVLGPLVIAVWGHGGLFIFSFFGNGRDSQDRYHAHYSKRYGIGSVVPKHICGHDWTSEHFRTMSVKAVRTTQVESGGRRKIKTQTSRWEGRWTGTRRDIPMESAHTWHGNWCYIFYHTWCIPKTLVTSVSYFYIFSDDSLSRTTFQPITSSNDGKKGVYVYEVELILL